MLNQSQVLGKIGEIKALHFLIKNKYKILEKNYKTKMGEIDIIAKKKKIYYFIEVKTRQTKEYGEPQEAVNFYKKRHIKNTAEIYLKKNNLFDKVNYFFEIIEIILDKESKIEKINLIKNAF